MLLSPLKFFILQALLILLIALIMFAVGKSCIKERPKNYLFFFIKIVVLGLLGALLLFVVFTTINPKFTLSLMRDYWRLEMVEDQIGYQQYQQEFTLCLGVKPNCARVVNCIQTADKHFYPDRTMAGQYIPTCDNEGNYTPLQRNSGTGYSWCVDKKGRKIPDTTRPPGKEPVDCATIAKEIDQP